MIDWSRQCVAVISCFNEAERIGAVVTQVGRRLPHVVVVDDGSTDDTGKVARQSGASVIRLPQNRGKGAALRSGWQCASERGFTWVLMLDGDGQHAPDDAPRFFERADRSQAKLVVGNRMTRPDAMPWLRRKVNVWMSRQISRLAGAALPDSQCGFRLAHLETLLGLTLATKHFEIESEMLTAFLAAGYRVEFVPVQTIYHAEQSRIRPLPDAWRWFLWYRRQQANRFRGLRASEALWRPQSNTIA